MKVVLFQPDIPQNTGNIVRTCVATNSSLILVRPLGFSTSSRQLKRAGLDYWEEAQIEEIDDLELFLQNQTSPFYFFSSKATKKYSDVKFEKDAILIFGSESHGLPPHFHTKWQEKFLTLPMNCKVRCLNISNSVAIVLYEALRQNNFCSIAKECSIANN